MHKKSQINYIQLLIIALIFLIIALPLYFKVKKEAEDSARLTQCKASVESNARLHLSGLDFSKNIQCPAKELTIKTKDQTEIKRTLANEMVECWDIFKKGEADLFSGEGTFCAICSRIDFKNKESEVIGFSKFLAETTKPKSDQTYLAYLNKYSTDEAYRVLEKQPTQYNLEEESFPTNKDYAVIFVYAKGKNSIEKLAKFLSAQTTAGKIGYTAAGVSVAAGGVGVGLAAFGILSNPIGWAIGIAGGIAAVGSLTISFFLDPENVPEWTALTMFSEYSEERLKQEIGCSYLPVEQS